eukprot:Partr_v1_DN28857_c1_g1_i3_m33975 putative Niemann-Pick disease type C1
MIFRFLIFSLVVYLKFADCASGLSQQCVMFGEYSPGINKPDNGQPRLLDDQEARYSLEKFCGGSMASGPVCCDSSQISSFTAKMKMAFNLLGGCEACWRNFLDFWCHFTCSPVQSSFVNVTALGHQGKSVAEVDFYLAPSFGIGFFDSCSNVKVGADNSFAMTLIGGGASNYLEMARYMGVKRFAGSMFQIDFPDMQQVDPPFGVVPLDIEAKSCNSGQFACSCVDCESSCPILPSPVHSICDVNGVDCRQIVFLALYVALVLGLVCYGFIRWWRQYDNSLLGVPGERSSLLSDTGSSEDVFREAVRPSSWRPRSATQITYETVASPMPDFNVFFDTQYFDYGLNAWLEKVMHKIGYGCALRPYTTIACCLVLVSIASIGVSNVQVETDPIKLWVDPRSVAATQKDLFDKQFGPFYRTQQLIMTRRDGTSVFRRDYVRSVITIVNDITSLEVEDDDGSIITLKDVCFQPLRDGECVVQSISAYWHNSLDIFDYKMPDESSFRNEALQCVKTPSVCLPPFLQPLKAEFVLGGYQDLDDVLNSRALITTIVINNSEDQTKKARAQKFEKRLLQYFQDLEAKYADSTVAIAFSTEGSIESELNRQNTGDIPTILTSYLVMFVYASFALGKFHMSRRFLVDARFGLGFGGIVIVIASVLSALGLYSYTGQKVTLIIAEVIPFLVLAIGVDNIFILVHAFDRETLASIPPRSPADPLIVVSRSETIQRDMPSVPPEVRMGRALGRIGPSMFLAGTTEVMAFAIGSFVGMPAVKSFAIMAALAIAINFLLQISWFVALLSIDATRREQGRADCLPCIPWLDSPDYSPGFLQTFIKHYYGPFLLKRPVKLLVSVVFSALFMFSIYTMNLIEYGLDQRIALPRDSYLVNYFDNLEEHFKVGAPLYWVISNVDAASLQGQSQLCSRFQNCSQWSVANILEQERKRPNSSYIGQPTALWLDDLFMWLNPSGDCCRFKTRPEFPDELCDADGMDFECEHCLNLDTFRNDLDHLPKHSDFVRYLDLFLSMNPSPDCALAGAAAYRNAISFAEEPIRSVSASHLRTYHTVLRTQHDFIAAYKAALRIADEIKKHNPGMEIFPYSIFYVFFEQYLTLTSLATTLISVGLAIIYLNALLLLGSFVLAFIMTMMVMMVLVDLIGVMVWWEIQLNAVTLVNLVIAMGISVEFCSHLTRAFSVTSHRHDTFAEGIIMTGSRNRRVLISLIEVGSSVFSGITLTKFLGISVLAFAQSKIFEVYYFRMYLSIVSLGFLHGLVLLPILLSWFGTHRIVRSGTYALEHESRRINENRPYSIYAEIVDQAYDD